MLRRFRLIREIEKTRGSRVITLIHRQEALSLLGIPLIRYITVEDSEKILRAIRFTPQTTPIDLIIHTPGGLVLASEQIARALQRHKSYVNIIVPHYAMSGGTLISLVANEILMDENAVLGPVDPQLGNIGPATSLIKLPQIKPTEKMKDETLVLLDLAAKASVQVKRLVLELLENKGMDKQKSKRIAEYITTGRFTHDFPLSPEKLEAIGIKVNTQIPNQIYELMDLYPQAPQSRPSVEYIPVPYTPEPQRKKDKGSSSDIM